MDSTKQGTFWLGALLMGLTAGCSTPKGVDLCADIPPGAIPVPPHATVHRMWETQAAKAEADDFVIYRHEFYMDGAELGPYGQYHLRLIANRLSQVPFPVLIQAVTDAKLNEQRRQAIVAYLKKAGHENIEQRVILGFPEAEGLNGEEAERVNNALPQAGPGVSGFNGINQPFNRNGYNNGFFGGRNNFFRSGSGFNSFPF